MKLITLKSSLGKELIEMSGSTESEILGVAYDSRKVIPSSLFVCIKGTLSDGHEYIDSAIQNGAKYFILDNPEVYEKRKNDQGNAFILVKDSRKALSIASAAFFDFPAEKLKIVGITGTKGKTSTSFMIREILLHAGFSVGIIGTVGTYYADKYEYIDNSTPESYELHRVFADMLFCGITHVIMEVSSQAVMLYRTYGIHFDTAVFTNISPDHIGPAEHNSFEEYLDCKGKLFTVCDRAVVNIDSDHVDYILNILRTNNVPITTFSAKKSDADYYAHDPVYEMHDSLYTSFELNDLGRFHVNIPGTFSLYNATAASAVAFSFGVCRDDIKAGLDKVSVIGRVETVKHEKCDFAIVIDYAHNALSLESLFKSIAEYNPNRIICVFGCGGNRSKLRRYDMGEISGKYADLSVITSDNPRYEKLDDILTDILIGMHKTDGKYEIIKDRREAIFYALSVAKKGDIVILAGKGNQDFEEIEGIKHHFDEREVIKEYFDK